MVKPFASRCPECADGMHWAPLVGLSGEGTTYARSCCRMHDSALCHAQILEASAHPAALYLSLCVRHAHGACTPDLVAVGYVRCRYMLPNNTATFLTAESAQAPATLVYCPKTHRKPAADTAFC